jgi:hypothetical protein
MGRVLRSTDADKLAAFARAARPGVAKAVRLTARGGPQGHAERLVEHWRREAVVLTGVTGLGGRLAWAAQDAVSAAVQFSLVLCLCEVAGVHDLRERVRVTAAAALDRELPPDWQPRGTEGESEPDADEERTRGRLLELGRQIWSVRRVVNGRRGGRLWHRGLAMVPVVGAAGLLLGERHALEGLAARAAAELATARG